MKIEVKYIEEDLRLEFVDTPDGKRLWIRNNDFWFPSIGWCPHIDISGGECRDCALVVEGDDEY